MTAILATLILGMAPAANAAPGKSPGASTGQVTPLVACSGNGCNGTNPDSTGCSATVETIDQFTGTIHNSTTGLTYTAAVQLRYSTACRTVWARVLTTDPLVAGFAKIIRNSDGRTYGFTSIGPLAGEFGCFTAQVYDGGVTSFAQGFIEDTTTGDTFSKRTISF